MDKIILYTEITYSIITAQICIVSVHIILTSSWIPPFLTVRPNPGKAWILPIEKNFFFDCHSFFSKILV